MDVVESNFGEMKRARFNTTRWSVILRARDSDVEERRLVWAEVVDIYWYPLYVYCRRRGATANDANDFTQGFFAQLIAADGLNTVTPAKGMFRSYLLNAFRNFVSNEYRKDDAQKRGGNEQIVSIFTLDPEIRYSIEAKTEETPERAFERNCAETLLARAKDRLAEEYHKSGKSELYAKLQTWLTNQDEAISQVEISRQLNLTPVAVRKNLQRMRRRLGDLILQEIAATVENPQDVEAELQNLMAAIRR